MATLAEVNVRIGTEISQFQRGLRQAERELERTASRFNNLGNSLSVALTLPLAAAGAAAFRFASQFESSTTKIENLVGVQGQELDDLKKKFQELGPVVGKTQAELADAALFITGAGLRGAKALDALEASAKASAIGLGDQTSIAKVAGAAVAAYADSNLTASESVDKLLAIVREGNAEASELAPVLGSVLPVASQLGVSFDEVGANIATFTKLGVGASTAADGLRSLLGNLLKPSEQAAKELAKIGTSAEQVRQSIQDQGLAATLQELITAFDGDTEGLARVFGDVQGLTNVLATAGAQGEVYAETLRNIQASAGGVEQAFQKTSQTAEFKLQKALGSLNAAATKFGAVIIPVVTDLLNAVTPLVQGFASLDAENQKLIIGFGVAAAAAGPLFRAIGTGIQTYSVARSAVLSFSKAIEFTGSSFKNFQAVSEAGGNSLGTLQNGLKAAAVGWRTLDTAAKATVIGAALAVVIALGFAIHDLTSELSEAAKVQQTLNEVNLQAEKDIAKQRIEAERLTAVLTDNNSTLDERQAALKRLNQIAPEYFGNLSAERVNVEDVTAAYTAYTAEILRAARAKAAEAKIVELEKERLAIAERLREVQQGNDTGTFSEQIDVLLAGSGGRLQTVLQNQINDIEAQQKALADVAFNAQATNDRLQESANRAAAAPLTTGRRATGTGSAPVRAAITAPDLLPTPAEVADSVAFLASVIGRNLEEKLPQVSADLKVSIDPLTALGEQFDIIENKGIAFGNSFDVTGEKLRAVESAMAALLDNGANPYGNAITTLQELQAGLNEELLNGASAADQMRAAYEQLSEGQRAVVDTSQAIAEAIVQTSETGKASLGEYAQAVGNAARKAISAFIAEGVTAAAARALAGAPFPANLILAPIAGATAAALFNSIIPKFAEGGIVTGPTYGLIGEAGPEVIFPLADLKRFIGEGGGATAIYGRLEGADILLSNDRSQARRARRAG